MITCTCGKTIDKVPTWMASVNVEFVCNNCPNRQTKNIAFVSLEPDVPVVAALEVEEEPLDAEVEVSTVAAEP
ncbi:MAG: hypothetical protein ACYC96_15075 [Fimbriimonadaceae bacterium]